MQAFLALLLGFVLVVLIGGFIPVLVNKTTEVHFDWLRPHLRECWTGALIVLTAGYVLLTPLAFGEGGLRMGIPTKTLVLPESQRPKMLVIGGYEPVRVRLENGVVVCDAKV